MSNISRASIFAGLVSAFSLVGAAEATSQGQRGQTASTSDDPVQSPSTVTTVVENTIALDLVHLPTLIEAIGQAGFTDINLVSEALSPAHLVFTARSTAQDGAAVRLDLDVTTGLLDIHRA